MLKLKNLIDNIKQYNENFDSNLIINTYKFAKNAHKNQKRLSGQPYITHPLNVAIILSELKLDEKTISAALIHDVIENCNITEKEIEKQFGKEIAFLVEGVTIISNIKFRDKAQIDSENVKKLLLASAKDIRVILIKLADRLDNMRTLKYLLPEKQKIISNFTLEVYAPIAYRLGLGEIKAELEDLSFKYFNPKEYNFIQKRLDLTIEERKDLIKQAKYTLLKNIKESGIHCKIDGRAKHIYSIYRKIKYKNTPLEKIYDLIALRILVRTVKDCYNALGIVHSLYKPLPGYLKDYIASPKSNMYRSLHTVVIGPKNKPIEIQIKTEEMHMVNEEGIAAHYRYKGFEEDERFHKKLFWVKEILEWQKNLDYKDFIENVKIDLFDYDIFVFTPKGDIIRLPKGSTPVDFAYAVHSQIGDRCSGAFLNDRFVPLDYELSNGDIIKIITQKNHKPGKDWLKFVKTNKARSKILQSLKEQGIPFKSYRSNYDVINLLIKTEGIRNPAIKFSRCCNPIPVEKIKAYRDIYQNIVIHKFSCSNENKRYTKPIKVAWNEDFNSQVEIKIISKDKEGLLGNLLNVFYKNNIALKRVNAKTIDKNLAECNIVVDIDNIKLITTIFNNLSKIEEIRKIQIGELVLSPHSSISS